MYIKTTTRIKWDMDALKNIRDENKQKAVENILSVNFRSPNSFLTIKKCLIEHNSSGLYAVYLLVKIFDDSRRKIDSANYTSNWLITINFSFKRVKTEKLTVFVDKFWTQAEIEK